MMKIKYFSLPNRFFPFLSQVLSLYVYAIRLKEFRHSMVLGKSNTKVSEKYCRAPVDLINFSQISLLKLCPCFHVCNLLLEICLLFFFQFPQPNFSSFSVLVFFRTVLSIVNDLVSMASILLLISDPFIFFSSF